MTWTTWIGLGCLVAGQAVAPAAPANFAGTWAMTSLVMNPKPAGGGSAALPPSDEVLRQTATSLSIDRTAFGQVITQTFAFDGTESTNRSSAGASVLVSRSRWVGKKLVTEGKISQVTSAGYDEWTFKETRSLTPAGIMVVETEQVGRDGTVTASTRQYRRKS